MKFVISRSSHENRRLTHLQPIDGAVYAGKDEDDEEETVWEIEINTLEELMDLRKRAKENLIVRALSIEIYDDRIE